MITKEELKIRLLNTNLFENNEWLDKYVNLLIDNKLNKHIKGKSQLHHAFPKSYSKALNIPIDNSENNLFELIFNKHVLAHIYLEFFTIDKNLSIKNNFALSRMLKGKSLEQIDKETLEYIDYLQQEYENSILMSGENHPCYGKKRPDLSEYNRLHPHPLSGERNGMYGKCDELSPRFGTKHSDETKEKMSESWDYNKHITPEFIEKQKLANANHIKNRTGRYSPEAKAKALETKIKNGTLNLSEDTKLKISDSKSKPIICLTTGVSYKSALEASKLTGLDRKKISENCRGKLDFVKYNKKQKSKRPINYVYDDTKYIFAYLDGGNI